MQNRPRLTTKTYELLKADAQKNRRTISAQLEVILERHYKDSK